MSDNDSVNSLQELDETTTNSPTTKSTTTSTIKKTQSSPTNVVVSQQNNNNKPSAKPETAPSNTTTTTTTSHEPVTPLPQTTGGAGGGVGIKRQQPSQHQHQHIRTVSAGGGGIGGGAGGTGVQFSSPLPPPASLSRAPRIILEEKERRERAAQEMLGGQQQLQQSVESAASDTIDSSSSSHQQQHYPDFNANTGTTTTITATTGGPRRLSLHLQENPFMNISTIESPTSATTLIHNKQFHVETHHFQTGLSTISGEKNKRRLGMLSQSLQNLDEHVAVAGTGTNDTSPTANNFNFNSVINAQSSQTAEQLMPKALTTGGMNASNFAIGGGFPSNPALANHFATTSTGNLGQQQQQQQQHAPSNIEYLIKTEHGAAHNKPTVKFNAQQESMALASIIGGGGTMGSHHHHYQHHNRNHSKTASTSPQNAAALSLTQRPSSAASLTQQQQQLQQPRRSSADQQQFTAEQLAAIQAFSGLPQANESTTESEASNRAPPPQHVRAVSSKFYTKHHQHTHSIQQQQQQSTAAAAVATSGNNNNNNNIKTSTSQPASPSAKKSQQQQLQQEQLQRSPDLRQEGSIGQLSDSRSGAYTTPQQTSQDSDNANHIDTANNNTNPLQGIAGCIIASKKEKSKKKAQVQSPKATVADNNTSLQITTGVVEEERAGSSSSTSSGANIVYAGFGPRDTIEVPRIPYDSAWKQNTLPSIRYTADALGSSLLLLLVCITCLPLGTLLIVESSDSRRIDVRYDNISKYRAPISYNATNPSSDVVGDASGYLWSETISGVVHRQGVKSLVRFNLTEALQPPIIMSYGLTEFFQNHLNVQQSKSFVQNSGGAIVSDLDVANCAPLLHPGELKPSDVLKAESGLTFVDDLTTSTPKWKQYRDFMYLPCGSQAWAMFNDSFAIFKVPEKEEVFDPGTYFWTSAQAPSTNPNNFSRYRFFSPDSRLNFTNNHNNNNSNAGATLLCNSSDFSISGERLSLTPNQNPCEKAIITVKSDSERFKAPNFKNNGGLLWMNTAQAKYNTSDVYLANGWYIDEPGHSLPSVFDLDLQIWMRVAPLSNFRKVLRIITQEMPAGQYQIEIDEYWDSTSFNGEKFVSFETRRSIVSNGGNSFSLGAVHVGTGVFAFLLLLATIIDRFVTGE